jgi:hypothetical protein
MENFKGLDRSIIDARPSYSNTTSRVPPAWCVLVWVESYEKRELENGQTFSNPTERE